VLNSVLLDDHCVLAVTGSDRATFLQGQLTQDVAAARPDTTVMTGWADAKGRLLFAGHLFSTTAGGEPALALLVPASLAETLVKRLRMYVMRANATLTLLDCTVVGLIGITEAGLPDRAIRIPGRSERHLLVGETTNAARLGRSAWQLVDIRSGIPVITAATMGEFVPQMVNLDLLGGISFTKGCYTGQEIVARMKYLGRVKRRMMRFSGPYEPPAAGAPVYADRGVAGQVVSSAPVDSGAEFLAVVTLDDLPGPFHLDAAGTQPIRRLELPYEIPR
jgi:folate-binding protein YgfZ